MALPFLPIFLFMLFLSTFRCSEEIQGNWNVNIEWFGEKSPCVNESNCSEKMIPVKSYACNNGLGWNNGLASFEDKIPKGYTAVQINLTVTANNCLRRSLGAVMYFTVQGEIVGSVNLPSGNCSCRGCMNEYHIQSKVMSQGWPGYAYGQSNQLSIIATQNGICVHNVNISISYAWVYEHPTILSIIPSSGPINGNTSIIVNGFSFYDGLTCKFGDVLADSYFFWDQNTLWCLSPNFSESKKVIVTVVDALDQTTRARLPTNKPKVTPIQENATVYYYYYENPVVTSIDPTEGNIYGGVKVTLFGNHFWNSSDLYCKFGENEVQATFLDEYSISCVLPPGLSPGPTPIQVSENHQQWFKVSCNFEYKIPPPLPPNSPESLFEQNRALVIAVGCGFVLVVILVILLIWRWKNSNRAPDVEYQSVVPDTPDFKGDIQFNSLQLKERIGHGSAGEIYRAIWLGSEVAIKLLPKHLLPNVAEREKFLQEADLMKQIRHPHVIQFLGLSISKQNICIVMEYMPLGSLYQQIHNPSTVFSWIQRKNIFIDCTKGLGYLHSCKPIIIHRDLKSNNFLIDANWRIKVADFGLSKVLDRKVKTMTSCGTPCWTAPEVLRREYYTEKADIYSLGVVFWELITREHPYEGLDAYQVVYAVATSNHRPSIPSSMPRVLVSLLQSCWNEDPASRPSASLLLIQLEQLPDTLS